MIPIEYRETTPIPNVIFDRYLSVLPASDLKTLLVILRQTYGWVDKATGKRKVRDHITLGQFALKTGVCKRTVTNSIRRLVERGLVSVGDEHGNLLLQGPDRRGKALYYGYGQRRSCKTQSIGEILNRVKVS
jgi:hypothetical protein